MRIPSSPYSVTQLTISCFILYFLLCLLLLVLLPVCYFPGFCSPVFCRPPVSYSSYWPSVFMRVFIIRCLRCSLSHWSFLVCFYLFFKSLCASRVTLSFFCWTFVYYIHPGTLCFGHFSRYKPIPVQIWVPFCSRRASLSLHSGPQPFNYWHFISVTNLNHDQSNHRIVVTTTSQHDPVFESTGQVCVEY